MQCCVLRVAFVVAAIVLFQPWTASAAPGGNGGGGGGGGGGNNANPTTLSVDCTANPTTALNAALATVAAQPQSGWTLQINGQCTTDLELAALDGLRLVASPAATAKPAIAGYVYATKSTRLSISGIDLVLSAAKPFGLYCDDQSDCSLTDVNVTGAGSGAAGASAPDGVVASRRARVSLTSTNISGFRIGLFVNNGAKAGFVALNGAGTINDMRLDGIYVADGGYVSFEGGVNDAGVATAAQITNVGRNGATLFDSSLRLRAAQVAANQSADQTVGGFPVEAHAGAGVHVQRSTLTVKPGTYDPASGKPWPSIYLANLAQAYFVDGGAVVLTGPIQCAGKYATYETFGSSVSADSIGCN